MKLTRKFFSTNLLVAVAFFFLAAIAPQTGRAHGEVEIQIRLLTHKIEAASEPSALLFLDRAELHREHKDWDAAKADYARAAELDPKLPFLDLFRARMLSDADELEAALAAFNQIISRTHREGEAYMGRARVWVKLRELKKAADDFRQGLAHILSPPPEYFLEFAQALVADGKTVEAIKILDQGIQRAGPILPLQGYALELELNRGNREDALARIDTLIVRASRKENFLAQRGDILLALGRFEEARESYESALAAVRLLPMLLQKAPPMQNLQTRIQAALEKVDEALTSSRAQNQSPSAKE